jgi:hypothetical protein
MAYDHHRYKPVYHKMFTVVGSMLDNVPVVLKEGLGAVTGSVAYMYPEVDFSTVSPEQWNLFESKMEYRLAVTPNLRFDLIATELLTTKLMPLQQELSRPESEGPFDWDATLYRDDSVVDTVSFHEHTQIRAKVAASRWSIRIVNEFLREDGLPPVLWQGTAWYAAGDSKFERILGKFRLILVRAPWSGV